MTARVLPMWELSAALVGLPDARPVEAFFRTHGILVTDEGAYFCATVTAPTGARQSWAGGKGQSLADFLTTLATLHTDPAQEAA